MLHRTVRAVAELSQGKPARVVDPKGGVHRVLGEQEQGPAEALDIAEKVVELDSQVRATVSVAAALAVQVEGMAARLDGVLNLVETAAAGQEQFKQDLNRLIAVMLMPVEPVYNEKGVIVAGVRVEKVNAKSIVIGGVRYEKAT